MTFKLQEKSPTLCCIVKPFGEWVYIIIFLDLFSEKKIWVSICFQLCVVRLKRQLTIKINRALLSTAIHKEFELEDVACDIKRLIPDA